MSLCNGCGGVLGRDCFNTEECQQICTSIASDSAYNEGYQAALASLPRISEEELRQFVKPWCHMGRSGWDNVAKELAKALIATGCVNVKEK